MKARSSKASAYREVVMFLNFLVKCTLVSNIPPYMPPGTVESCTRRIFICAFASINKILFLCSVATPKMNEISNQRYTRTRHTYILNALNPSEPKFFQHTEVCRSQDKAKPSKPGEAGYFNEYEEVDISKLLCS